jgi:hypothetical protein
MGDTGPITGDTTGGAGMGSAGMPSFGSESFGAGVGANVGMAAPGGYLDSAIPMTMFRLRYDTAYNLNRPDRAEYIYGAWQELSFHPHGIVSHGVANGVFVDANTRGPTQSGNQVDYQEASVYFEYAFARRFSAFVDLPYRFVHFRPPFEGGDENGENPDDSARFPEGQENANPNNNPNGISDLQFGFKYAFIADPDQFLTLQFRTYVPTGDAGRGLGTGHVSVEPALLYYKQMTERLVFQAQLMDWIPIGGTAEAGNVLSYGAGFAYDVYRSCNLRVAPVVEMLGWTVLSGYESFFLPDSTFNTAGLNVPSNHGVANATGDTIINGKIGVRTYFGDSVDFYVGYGRALTGDHWYTDIVRAELRIKF